MNPSTSNDSFSRRGSRRPLSRWITRYVKRVLLPPMCLSPLFLPPLLDGFAQSRTIKGILSSSNNTTAPAWPIALSALRLTTATAMTTSTSYSSSSWSSSLEFCANVAPWPLRSANFYFAGRSPGIFRSLRAPKIEVTSSVPLSTRDLRTRRVSTREINCRDVEDRQPIDSDIVGFEMLSVDSFVRSFVFFCVSPFERVFSASYNIPFKFWDAYR